jgi:hypothetical protein
MQQCRMTGFAGLKSVADMGEGKAMVADVARTDVWESLGFRRASAVRSQCH